jgi:hypothetical protein
MTLAHAAADALSRFTDAAGRAADRVDAEDVVVPDMPRAARTLDGALTERDLSILYRAGIRIEELERTKLRRVDRPVAGLRDALHAAARESSVFAGVLMQWEPARDILEFRSEANTGNDQP